MTKNIEAGCHKRAIALTKVSFRYKGADQFALKDLSFSLEAGQCAVITGSVGAGKSTLCHCLNGLIPQVIEGELKGHILVGGKDVSRFRVQTLSREVGLVMQDPEVQIVGRTVAEDVAFGPRNYLVPADVIPGRISDALTKVGLDGYEHRNTEALSGGEKQRLAIAGILAMETSVLVLDEPASELDPAGKAALYTTLSELKESRGVTLIIVEQKIDDLPDMVDHLFFMENGSLKKHAPSPIPFHDSSKKTNTLFEAKKSSNGPVALKVDHLFFSHTPSRLILNDINLTIRQDDFIALMGHNGAGKTTLAKHLNGLIPCQSSGSVTFYGKEIHNLKSSEMASLVGFVFQNPDHQIFESSVEKEVGLGLFHQGITPAKISYQVDEALALTGLETVKHAHPFTLGKGVRQLIALASIVVMKPKVLIVDEPTTGLDAQGAMRVMEILHNLHSTGTAIVFITHDMALAAQYAQRLVVMEGGKIIKSDNF